MNGLSLDVLIMTFDIVGCSGLMLISCRSLGWFKCVHGVEEYSELKSRVQHFLATDCTDSFVQLYSRGGGGGVSLLSTGSIMHATHICCYSSLYLNGLAEVHAMITTAAVIEHTCVHVCTVHIIFM